MTNDETPEPSDEIQCQDDLFDDPIDPVDEQETLQRLHRRNLKRIFIPMGVVILLSIVLGMIGPPDKSVTSDQSDATNRSQDR